MGASTIATAFKGQLTREQVKEKFNVLVNTAAAETDYDPYSGSWNTIENIKVMHDTVHENANKAFDSVIDYLDKCEAASLLYKDKDGEINTLFCGWAAE